MVHWRVARRGRSVVSGWGMWWGAGPAIAAAVVAVIVGFGGREARAAEGGPAAIGDTVLANGQVAFDDDLVGYVRSPVAGRVTRVLAHTGERVAKGAPLVVIASPELKHVVPDKLQAEADLAAAEGELQRQRQLFDAHEGVTERLEAARAGLALAKKQAAHARLRAELVKSLGSDEMTGSFTLTAPRAGVVLASTAAPGGTVAGPGLEGGGADLFAVGSLERVWVIGRVSRGDLPNVKAGASVTVQAAGIPGKVFTGRVVRILAPGPELQEAAVRCAAPNPDGALKPGMAATLAIAVR